MARGATGDQQGLMISRSIVSVDRDDRKGFCIGSATNRPPLIEQQAIGYTRWVVKRSTVYYACPHIEVPVDSKRHIRWLQSVDDDHKA